MPGPRAIARALLAWQRTQGRHGLPWQDTRDPYRVWLSEVMLQQTRVATVLDYYPRFLARFPDVWSLARAPLEDVLRLWAGLGYYARARNLHRCAIEVCERHGGVFPADAAALAALPGLGRSTASAIAAFCHGERVAILDANARRVVARLFAVEGDLRSPAIEARLWEHAQSLLPLRGQDMPAYTQAVMDLGAGPCAARSPRCALCPVPAHCEAFRQGIADRIPAPRARKARPERKAHFLVVVSAGRVLLAPRPPEGIWGGLLAPPTFESCAALRRAAVAWGGARPRALAPQRHEFTHFTLVYTAHVLALDAKESKPLAPVAGQRWVDLDGIGGEALPAPLGRLLLGLAADSAAEGSRRHPRTKRAAQEPVPRRKSARA